MSGGGEFEWEGKGARGEGRGMEEGKGWEEGKGRLGRGDKVW